MLPQASNMPPKPQPIKEGPRIVLVEDDPVMGQSLVDWFQVEGYRAAWFRTGSEAIRSREMALADVVVCDIRLPDMAGEEVYRALAPRLCGVPFLFVTGYGDVDQAVRLMKAGAADYMTKPFEIEILLARISKLVAQRWVLSDGYELGLSPAIVAVERQLRRLAGVNSSVLLTGPSGAGKEVAARFLHAHGYNRAAPFVAINCAAIPGELLESEIFGHERGAFTGAQTRRIGLAEQAGEGVFFLDEVGELPRALQAKLLRLLQERNFTRIAGDVPLAFRARVIAATNVDLAQRVRDGLFREDLFYRIAVVSLALPPLKARPEDIVALADRFLAEFTRRFAMAPKRFSALVEEALLAHDFPGNIRELRNRIERAVALADGELVGPADLFPENARAAPADTNLVSLQSSRDLAEKRAIVAALAATAGDVALAAQRLEVSRSTLFEKIRRLNIRTGA